MLRAALGAVIDLERDTKSKLGQRGAVNALGAAFRERRRGEIAEHDRIEPALTRDQMRRGEAGLHEPSACAPPLRRQPVTGAEPCKATRQRPERECKSGDRATVDTSQAGVQRDSTSL